MFDILEDAGLRACLEFIIQADALKKILRKTSVIKNIRRENTAEHSWHLALMAMVLHRYANEPVNIERVVKMLILHDLGEIDIGDTFFYDAAARVQAQQAEFATIERLFSTLPPDLRQEFTELWLEVSEGTSPEARFARSMDRLEPFLSNLANDGGSWLDLGISKEMALTKNKLINEGSSVLWDAYQRLAAQADEDGLFSPGKKATG